MSTDDLTARVRKEMTAWPPRPDLWAYAVQISQGDEAKCTELYIKFRVAELQMATEVTKTGAPERANTETATPFAANEVALRPDGIMSRLFWNAASRVVSNEGLFNLLLGGFVAVITFAALFLNGLGSRAWWLLLPVGQVANLYLGYRLSGYPLHLLASTKGAQARLQILLNIFVLTVLLVFMSAVMPLVARWS